MTHAERATQVADVLDGLESPSLVEVFDAVREFNVADVAAAAAYLAKIAGSGESPGGSTPGAAIVRGPLTVAYNDAGLTNGVTVYTPAVDEILLDAWVEVDTAWDGTTPSGDLGQFVAVTFGYWATAGIGPLNMMSEDAETAGAGYSYANQGSSQPALSGASIISSATLVTRQAPGRFTTTSPLKFVVSQDGTKGGASPGAAQGAARIYIVTATPVALP